MKFCSCIVVRAWMLPFGFGPDICSYLPLAKFHGFCIFRDNLSSSEWISMKLYSCNVVRAWTLPFGFGPDICSYLPLAKFHRFCNFHDNLSSNEQIPMKLYIYKALSAYECFLCVFELIFAVICPWQNFAFAAIFGMVFKEMLYVQSP